MSVQIKGSGTIGGIDEGLNITGVTTATNFKTGVSNLHSTGLTLTGGQLDVGSNIKIGTAGVVTATSFVGSGANLTSLPAQATLSNNADNRIITGGSGTNLNGEQYLTFDGTILNLTKSSTTAYSAAATTNDSTANLINSGAAGHATLQLQSVSGGSANTGQATISAFNESSGSKNTALTFGTRQNSDATVRERIRITSDGKLTMSSGTVELQSHMVRVGNRTTSQINAGVSTSTGALTLDTTTNLLKYYANSQWASLKKQTNDGSTQSLAARSAKALLDDGITTSGVYFLDMHGAYSSGNAKRHYCLQDTSYDGGGWTLLYCMNHGNNFASGSNYSFALNVGSSPTSVNDFTASNFGYDRRNTFTPQANDQFLIRRSDNNDWKRFVVTTWSPTANSISDGWSCARSTEGTNRAHPYYALGQMYDSSGNSVSGMVHFNGCALGGNCNSGGGDGDGFGDHVNWSSGYSPYNCWGGAFNGQGNGGSPLYWGQTALSQGGSLYVQMFYRRTGTQ